MVVKLADLLDRLNKQEDSLKQAYMQIETLTKRIGVLEGQQKITDSLLFVKDRVIEEFSQQLNSLQQYTRRYSCIVKGIDKPRNETKVALKDEIGELINELDCGLSMQDVDKFHRNGPRRGKYQDVIVRFKSHDAKETFYRNRKNTGNEDIRISPSLTETNRLLLTDARDALKEDYADSTLSNPPDFVMADIHGVLQVKMKKKEKNQLFFPFKSIKHLYEIIDRCNSRVSDNEVDDYNDYLLQGNQDDTFEPPIGPQHVLSDLGSSVNGTTPEAVAVTIEGVTDNSGDGHGNS